MATTKQLGYRVNTELVDKLESEAKDERRNPGQQLEVILTERYDNKPKPFTSKKEYK